MSEPTPAVPPAADRPPDGGRVVWYRSFYWRIATGFVATVAVVLALQAALFIWLASTNETLGMRPARIATVAAAELSSALEADASLDVDAWLAREFGRGPHGVFVVRGDRIHRSGPFEVPPFLARMAWFRLRSPDAIAGLPGPPPDGRPPADGRGLRPRRPPFQPVVVRGQTVAVVGVLPAPPGGDPVLAEFGPTLIAAGLALLIAGTAVMAIAVFRPVHRRLRGLEQAAAAVGAGETAVRAPENGGDEVASVARRFNRMAADLDAWAQNHRKARIDALNKTKADLEAQGYKITEVKEL
jgi:HAMP domain-containing protein